MAILVDLVPPAERELLLWSVLVTLSLGSFLGSFSEGQDITAAIKAMPEYGRFRDKEYQNGTFAPPGWWETDSGRMLAARKIRSLLGDFKETGLADRLTQIMRRHQIALLHRMDDLPEFARVEESRASARTGGRWVYFKKVGGTWYLHFWRDDEWSKEGPRLLDLYQYSSDR